MHTHFEQLSQSSQSDPVQSVETRNSVGTQMVSAAIPNERGINPQWEILQDEMLHLAEELNGLLKTVTPNHPRVRDVTLQLKQLQRQSDTTPKFVADPTHNTRASATERFPNEVEIDGAVSNSASAAYTARETPFRGDDGAVPAVDLERFRALTEQHDRAIAQREAAERELLALMLRQRGDVRRPFAADRRVISPAALVRQIGGQPSTSSVAWIGLVSLISGVGMAWRMTTLGGLRRIITLEDLKRTLAVPIVGQVSIDPVSPSVKRLVQWGQVVRWCTHICELVLGVMVILFLVSLISGSPAVGELARNPLGTLVNRVADSLNWLL